MDGDFVVKRLCTDSASSVAAVMLVRQHLLDGVFARSQTTRSDDAALIRALYTKEDDGSLLSLRAYVRARPIGQWLTKAVLFALYHKSATQYFVCRVFNAIFLRHIVGLCDNSGRAVHQHVLVAERPLRVLNISVDGASVQEEHSLIDTYTRTNVSVLQLLRADQWSKNLREALVRLCEMPKWRNKMLEALDDITERETWHTVYDYVERYGVLTKVNVIAMQARLFQLRGALRRNQIV